MKKIALVMALAITTLLQAQENKDLSTGSSENHQKKELSPDEKAMRDAGRAEKKLSLSAEQKTKWEQAARERIIANSALREKKNSTETEAERKTVREQMMTNNKKFDETVSTFLTPDQKIKWEQTKQERKQHHKDKMQKQGN